MIKPPKIPRPHKPPVLPADPNPRFTDVGLIHERLIGRVVIAWSKLEAAMEDFIWLLLDLDITYGRLITRTMDADRKIKMLRKLGATQLPETVFHDLSPLLDIIDILKDDRNFIVHGTWAVSIPAGVPIALSVREKSKPDEVISESFTDIRMRTIHFEIECAKFQLVHLMEMTYALPGRPTPPRHER